LPAIVVIHENRGLNPYIEDVARRLAIAGFIAFAPDALTPLGGYPGNDDDGRALQRQRDRDEMVEDFLSAVEFVGRHPDCSGKVATVGFCFGGSMSLQMAIRVPTLAAAVAYYGSYPDPATAALIKSPLMLHNGELDERVNASWPAYEKALQAANASYRHYEYADADHGFHNDTTPRYDAEAAELSWTRSIDFFAQHLDAAG
jgi:carboxymethylenebutenolidase